MRSFVVRADSENDGSALAKIAVDVTRGPFGAVEPQAHTGP